MVQFLAAPQAMLSRERLLEALPGGDAQRGDRHLDFLVCRLRRLLGDTAGLPPSPSRLRWPMTLSW